MKKIDIEGNIELLRYIDLIDETNVEDYNEFIYQTKKTVYKKYVEQYWGKWDDEGQRKMFLNFINAIKNDLWLIRHDDKMIGFYNGETIDDNNYEIGNICIIPNYQGCGIGTKILKEMIKIHENQNLHLQYFKSNPVGELYKKLGFVPDYEKEFHYTMVKEPVKIKK